MEGQYIGEEGKKIGSREAQSLITDLGTESILPLPIASCPDRNEELEAAAAAAASRQRRVEESGKLQWWGLCQPYIVLLREALLSSAPDIAVVGPLHGCFTFYLTHLHNEVLSSSYAKTMFFGTGGTPLESAFMWLGAWRPTSALILVYSLMGNDIEDVRDAVQSGRGFTDASTASILSPQQLIVMNTLCKHTQHAEMKISKKHSGLQMLIGDQDMLEAIILDATSPNANGSSRFKRAREKRMSQFRRILVQAEDLRLHTLRNLLTLLTPIQAARFGVAVFEICSSLHRMGSELLPKLPVMSVLPEDTTLLPSTSFSSFPSRLDAMPVPVKPLIHPFLFSNASSSHTDLHPSHVLNRSDKSPILVPSCSNSSSPLAQHSSSPKEIPADFNVAERLSFEHQLKFPPSGGGISADHGNQLTSTAESKEWVTSSRLLILSPSSSDVTIQSCSLGSELPVVDMQRQPSLANEEFNKTESTQELQESPVPILSPISPSGHYNKNESDLDWAGFHESAKQSEAKPPLEISLSSLGLYD